MSEYNIQMNKYNALNAEYDQLYPQPMKHASTHAKDGSDPILPSSIGAASLDDSGKVPVDQLPFKPQIIVTAPTGSTVIATLGSKTYTAAESAGTWTFDVDEYGVYTVTATLGADTASTEVEVNVVKQYAVDLAYFHIYGVEWDGTSSQALTRTDAAGCERTAADVLRRTLHRVPEADRQRLCRRHHRHHGTVRLRQVPLDGG